MTEKMLQKPASGSLVAISVLLVERLTLPLWTH